MLTRRDALRSLLAAPLVLTPFGLRPAGAQQGVALLDVRRQRQFVNPLPRPARATPATAARHYELAVRQFRGSLGVVDPRTGRPCYRASREVCVNLSRGGLFIHTADPIAPGRRVLVEMHFPDGSPLEAVGRVAWSKRVLGALDEKPKDGIGVEFIVAPPDQLVALDDFLSHEDAVAV